MIRIPCLALALALLPLGAWAGESAVRLDVQAKAAPTPALKYLLLPRVDELHPGNPVQWYVRCFQEQRNFFFSKEGNAQRARYRTLPLDQLRAENIRSYGGNALRQADWAARLSTPDWEMVERVQTEGLDLMVAELGPLRILATALQARLRVELAWGNFDDAVRTAKTMFALARHLGEHPTEAAALVGLSITDLALDSLEEMIRQPGCPNLYWALTDLPCPLVDARKGVQGDRTLVEAELRPLRGDTPMTGDELEKLVSRLSGAMGFAREQVGQAPRNLRSLLSARVKDEARVRAARARLVEAATPPDLVQRVVALQAIVPSGGVLLLAHQDRVKSFPPLQVILLDEKHEYEVRRDEGMKLLALAPWQIDALAGGTEPSRGDGLFAELLPHVVQVRRTQARVEQRIGLLRHVEALRLYAAAHGGKLPQKLADIAVPLPDDPFTGKPFAYRVEGATAYLEGCPPRADEQKSPRPARYEITLRK